MDPNAVRILHAAATVDPALYAATAEATVVFEVPAGSTVEDIVAAVRDEVASPYVFAPPP
jgi:hypothetical protein